jgi:hypothetical protein
VDEEAGVGSGVLVLTLGLLVGVDFFPIVFYYKF